MKAIVIVNNKAHFGEQINRVETKLLMTSLFKRVSTETLQVKNSINGKIQIYEFLFFNFTKIKM